MSSNDTKGDKKRKDEAIPSPKSEGRTESEHQTSSDERYSAPVERMSDTDNDRIAVGSARVAKASQQLDVVDQEASTSFARLVKDWETYIHHGTVNMQRGFQHLTRCTDENHRRIPGSNAQQVDRDPFAPIVLRHTRSSPLTQSRMFGDGEDMPPPSIFDSMRRSSSTPSTTFRQPSQGSAFGTNVRTLPYFFGAQRGGSAFSLPMQRSTPASSRNMSLRNSAFDPIRFPTGSMDDPIERTSIEVTDVPRKPRPKPKPEIPIIDRSKKKKSQTATGTPKSGTPKSGTPKSGTPKSKFFLSESLFRRRNKRSGRENPARPSSSTTESESGTKSAALGKQDEDLPDSLSTDHDKQKKSSPRPKQSSSLTNDAEPDTGTLKHSRGNKNTHGTDNHSQQGSVGNQGQNSPSSTYFEPGAESGPRVRIQVSTDVQSPILQDSRAANVLTPQRGIAISESNDSGTGSPGTAMSGLTSSISGHTTLGTGTSLSNATSTGSRFTLSVVSETDREVMETNKAGKALRSRDQSIDKGKTGMDAGASVNSSSTTSSAAHGYLALDGSPAPLREGASLPTDRFFIRSTIGNGSNSETSGNASHDTIGAATLGTNNGLFGRAMSHLSTSVATTAGNTSISSTSVEPPQFVSYLDGQRTAISMNTRFTRESNVSPGDTAASTTAKNAAAASPTTDRESPARIVGYSHVMFEAAGQVGGPKIFRPVKKRDGRYYSRPPLSPYKGLRSSTTPPPGIYHGRSGSLSPAYRQLSPPHIVDHRIPSDQLSKPYVLRSAPQFQEHGVHRARTANSVLSSPEPPIGMPPEETTTATTPLHQASFAYDPSSSGLEQMGDFSPGGQMYRESSIEIKEAETASREETAVVTPEREIENRE